MSISSALFEILYSIKWQFHSVLHKIPNEPANHRTILIIAVEIHTFVLFYFCQLWILFRKFNMEHNFVSTTVPHITLLQYFACNLQINLEQAENLIKRHEAFLTTMEANDDKINNVVQFASRLCDECHFAGWWHNINCLLHR
jgi:hypothetical protein